MTGGRVVILGGTGRNFAAGMSGGVAYVWDVDGDFRLKCNMGLVELEEVEDPADIAELLDLIAEHQARTGSAVAEQILADWVVVRPQFVKVMPTDYKRVLLEQQTRAVATA